MVDKRKFKDINVSLLGLGTMRLPCETEQKRESNPNIDYDKAQSLVDLAYKNGVNYFDTAYMYHCGKSEAFIGYALKKYPRDTYYLADKLPIWMCDTKEDMKRVFDEQLERTGMDYFDFYLLHSLDNENFEKCEKFDAYDFLKKMQKEGKIKYIGFSFHGTVDDLRNIVSAHKWDFAQIQMNYLDWENDIIQSRLCYETARRHNKPIAVMESVKGGTLANLPKEAENILREYNKEASPASYALRFAANLDGVFMVLSGMSNCEQVLDNTKIMARPQPLNDKEKELLKEVVAIINKRTAIPCTSCGYCMEVCPKNINIPGLFALYNNYCINDNFSNMYYQRLIYNKGKASDCIKCHRCEKNCPQHIHIPDNLELIAKLAK